jgi:lysophospholipase L1-like esterase
MIQKNELILFQGDSITDCRRDRENAGTANDLHGMGSGYAMMVAAELLSSRPSDGLQFLNRGISGNRSVDLDARIKSDFINLRPTLASILIGVNDTWHEQRGGNGVSVPKYERIYRALLSEVREALPEIKFVLCEPFVLPCGLVTEAWIVEVNQRRAVMRQLAREFGATLVPFHSLFDAALEKAPPDYWAHDGVHPTAAGHMLMAKCWLQHVCGGSE